MLCEKCGNKEAVMKINEIVNNEKKTSYICEDCAMEMLNSHLSFGNFDPFSAFNGFFRDFSRSAQPALTCPSCGLTFRRFLDSGKFGCAHCYDAFGSALEPVLRKIHLNTEYKGKRPGDSPVRLSSDRPAVADPAKEESPREKLLREMKAAADIEDYETAAMCKKKLDAMDGGESDE